MNQQLKHVRHSFLDSDETVVEETWRDECSTSSSIVDNLLRPILGALRRPNRLLRCLNEETSAQESSSKAAGRCAECK